MKRWWSDTLFKRLFALMWVSLVVSHLAAFFVVIHLLGLPRGPGPGAGWHIPVLPSLPPMMSFRWPEAEREPPGQMARPPDDGPPAPRPPVPGDRPPHDADRDARAPAPLFQGGERSGFITTSHLLIDYGIRFLIIGIAAFFGARWLSRPMGRLASASRSLGEAVAHNAPPPKLDETAGTVEVRDTARVFNEMAVRLNDHVNARSLLVAAISHDLRTPLTRLRMRLESVNDEALVSRSIADIREMDELIESALEVFRGSDASEPARLTDVLALVQSVVDDLAELGQPVAMDGSAAQARVQPSALRRVVANLVGNALRYGQRADVRVEATPGRVSIVIDDQGPGIPEAQLEAVMQPFFRLEASRNRSTGGSGLGLYIARDLLSRQGGTLRLQNRPEGGLRAIIWLQAG